MKVVLLLADRSSNPHLIIMAAHNYIKPACCPAISTRVAHHKSNPPMAHATLILLQIPESKMALRVGEGRIL